MVGEADSCELLNLLTVKQRAALDLLVQHKTSKEISRVLGISPHTVDQRIDAAKRTLGTSTRGELAQRYLHLCEVCEGMTYERLVVADAFKSRARVQTERSADGAGVIGSEMLDPDQNGDAGPGNRLGSGLFFGQRGTAYRIIAIIVIALLVTLTTMAAMEMYRQAARVFF